MRERAGAMPGMDLPEIIGRWDGLGCPFQKGKSCTVHTIRPMGCRIFFCDASSKQWQEDRYEQFHGDLRRLHDALEVPYAYVEWRWALRELAEPLLQSGVAK